MLPTLRADHNWLLVDKLRPALGRSWQLGDIVVCISTTNPDRAVAKRILGLPGDKVLVDPTLPKPQQYQVPKGHVWVIGDNLSNSTDSRSFGPVPMALLRGRIVARVWPDPCWLTINA